MKFSFLGPGLKGILARNMGVQALTQAAGLFLGLATNVILSRYLGVQGFGQYGYVLAFFYFFLALNDFGTNTIAVREISQNKPQAGRIVGGLLSYKIFISLLSLGAAWLIIVIMGFQGALGASLLVYALILPVIALQFPGILFQSELQLIYPAFLRVLTRVLAFVFLMIIVFCKGGLVPIFVSVIVTEAIFTFFLVKRSFLFARPVISFDLNLWKRVLSSSIPLGITGLFVAVINRVDFVMLERMSDLRQVGLYAAAYKVTDLLESLPLMAMTTLYPVMARYAHEDLSRLRTVYLKAVCGFTAAALPVALIVSLFSRQIIGLIYGSGFVEAAAGLRVLIWATVSLYIAISGGSLLISLGREKINLYVNVVAALINVGLNFLLIPRYGFVGAAWATVVSFAFICVTTVGSAFFFLWGEPAGRRERGSV